MGFRPLKSFLPTADDVENAELGTLGKIVLVHLKSYEGLNTVLQHGRINKGYFHAMLENRNVGLGPLPKEPRVWLAATRGDTGHVRVGTRREGDICFQSL